MFGIIELANLPTFKGTIASKLRGLRRDDREALPRSPPSAPIGRSVFCIALD
jgi:hypothetical protein